MVHNAPRPALKGPAIAILDIGIVPAPQGISAGLRCAPFLVRLRRPLTGLAVRNVFPAFSPRDNEKEGKRAILSGV
jgi:hypothetical protein